MWIDWEEEDRNEETLERIFLVNLLLIPRRRMLIHVDVVHTSKRAYMCLCLL